jgi:hypothetical protein
VVAPDRTPRASPEIERGIDRIERFEAEQLVAPREHDEPHRDRIARDRNSEHRW